MKRNVFVVFFITFLFYGCSNQMNMPAAKFADVENCKILPEKKVKFELKVWLPIIIMQEK
jgi:hypothetical protein